jgi:nicotinamide riboside transporter PnuC
MYWSYILAAIGVTGTFFVGRKVIWAWLVLLVNECLWMIYAVTTKQYGFIIAAIAYAVVYIRSFLHWKNEDEEVAVSNYEILTNGHIDTRYIKIN